MLVENVFREKFIGGKCGREIPGNMPNPEVKPASVDGTVRGTYGRANRCQVRLRTMERKFTYWASSFYTLLQNITFNYPFYFSLCYNFRKFYYEGMLTMPENTSKMRTANSVIFVL